VVGVWGGGGGCDNRQVKAIKSSCLHFFSNAMRIRSEKGGSQCGGRRQTLTVAYLGDKVERDREECVQSRSATVEDTKNSGGERPGKGCPFWTFDAPCEKGWVAKEDCEHETGFVCDIEPLRTEGGSGGFLTRAVSAAEKQKKGL